MIRKLVGSSPILIGKKVPITYHGSLEDNYLEVCMDVARGGNVANSICTSVSKKADSITIDLSFLLEGRTDAELPEQVLAAYRIHNIKFAKSHTDDQWLEEIERRRMTRERAPQHNFHK